MPEGQTGTGGSITVRLVRANEEIAVIKTRLEELESEIKDDLRELEGPDAES